MFALGAILFLRSALFSVLDIASWPDAHLPPTLLSAGIRAALPLLGLVYGLACWTFWSGKTSARAWGLVASGANAALGCSFLYMDRRFLTAPATAFLNPDALLLGVGIAGLIRRVDAGTSRICDGAIALGHRREVIDNFININRIWLERGFVCHGLGRAQSGTSKLHDALRHGVDVGVDFGPERIQHLMHSDELDSFEIPMDLLCRECQIDGLGEAAVQNINGNSLRVRLEIIPCLMRFQAHFSSASLWLIKRWQSHISDRNR